jgi:hypothetical protein
MSGDGNPSSGVICGACALCSASLVARFFSIRSRVAKILPEPFLSGPMRALPVLLVFVAMFYWLWRVHTRVIVQRPQTT